MNTNDVLLQLATGAELVGSRVMPFPHAYAVSYVGGGVGFSTPVDVDSVRGMVDKKLVAGKPRDALWDTVDFTLTEKGTERVGTIYRHGYARCPLCAEVVGLSAGAKLARHGFTKDTPACRHSSRTIAEGPMPDAVVADDQETPRAA